MCFLGILQLLVRTLHCHLKYPIQDKGKKSWLSVLIEGVSPGAE